MGHPGLFDALLVGRLVVVAHGLYLARHLFTLLGEELSIKSVMSIKELIHIWGWC